MGATLDSSSAIFGFNNTGILVYGAHETGDRDAHETRDRESKLHFLTGWMALQVDMSR
jgi:hypothetical protein